MRLNELSDKPGARKAAKRVGRGIGSGLGKTAGRGHKGAKARAGVAINGFEGGQMPIHMRLPKRGFNKPNRASYVEINVGRLQEAVDAGKIDAGSAVDAATLKDAGLIRRVRDGVRLLGKGELSAKLDITVAHASKGAVAAVEKAGGSVTVIAPKVDEDAEAKRAKTAEKKAKTRPSGDGDGQG